MGLDYDGRPKFRIIWSTGVTEIRVGPYEIWYGAIFVSAHNGPRECLKYKADQERYVLEVLEFSKNPELPAAQQGAYEPIFIFRDSKGNFLRPNMKVLEYICWCIEHPSGKRSESMDRDEEKKEEDAEVELFKNMLAEEGRSVLFEADNSVFVDSTKRFQ